MAQLSTFSRTRNDWFWTGVRTFNQMWSYIRVTEPIIVTSIEAYWGGYTKSTKGRHFIAKWAGEGRLGEIVVKSNEISVPQGRAWRTAPCNPTLLEPGEYAVGVWGDYLGNRTCGCYPSPNSYTTYCVFTESLVGGVTGKKWSGNLAGVIPMRLNYEPAGRVHIKLAGKWYKGQVYIKLAGQWRKATGIWVKVGNQWRRSR